MRLTKAPTHASVARRDRSGDAVRPEPGAPIPAPILFRVARALAFVWRFQHLQLVKWLFQAHTGTAILRRRIFGGTLVLDVKRSTTHALLYLDGERFVDERRLFTGLLRPGMSVVDVGANIGYYALMARQSVGPEGRVVCFEPEPTNAAELRRNIAESGFTNVTVVEAAVGGERGSAKLLLGLNGTLATGEGEIEVPVVTVDAAMTSRVDLIKVDVEGFEGHVLRGAEGVIRADRPILFVEMHPGLVPDPSTIEWIVAFVRRYYSDVRYYDLPAPTRADKVRWRYLGRDPVRAVENLAAGLADAKGNSCGRTFWMVCRPDGAGTTGTS